MRAVFVGFPVVLLVAGWLLVGAVSSGAGGRAPARAAVGAAGLGSLMEVQSRLGPDAAPSPEPGDVVVRAAPGRAVGLRRAVEHSGGVLAGRIRGTDFVPGPGRAPRRGGGASFAG